MTDKEELNMNILAIIVITITIISSNTKQYKWTFAMNFIIMMDEQKEDMETAY